MQRDYIDILATAIPDPQPDELEVCDDCGQPYVGPAYYTFPSDACSAHEHEPPDDTSCTGNICPSCAGPYVSPDQPDPRQAAMQDQHPSWDEYWRNLPRPQ